MFSRDDVRLRKYAENMPYGKDDPSSKIHGPVNEQIIRGFIYQLFKWYDNYRAKGENDMASNFEGAIKHIAGGLDNLREIKKEYLVNKGGGKAGRDQTTELYKASDSAVWDKNFALENFSIGFRPPNFDITLTAPIGEDKKGEPIMMTKGVGDITENWGVLDDSPMTFSKMKQDVVDAADRGEPSPPFDISWAVHNLVKKSKEILAFEKDFDGSGKSFAQTWVEENIADIASGNTPPESLTTESILHEDDKRVAMHYINILNKSFHGENYQSQGEIKEAEELKSRIKIPNVQLRRNV